MSVTPLSPTIAPTIDTDFSTSCADVESSIPLDLSVVSTRRLRVLCNQLFRALDEDFPPYGARQDYALLVSELETREKRARQRP
jgi:hypothetical protein